MASPKFQPLRASAALKKIEDVIEAAGFELHRVNAFSEAESLYGRIPHKAPGLRVQVELFVPCEPFDSSESAPAPNRL